MTVVLGVDPGALGALAIVDTSLMRIRHVLDMPTVRLGNTTWVDGAQVLDWLDGRAFDLIVIEVPEAHSSKMAPSTVIQMGRGAGGIVSVLLAAGGRPLVLTRPGQWKKRAGLLKSDKKASLLTARATFGGSEHLTLAKHDGRAEAALIALYGRPAEKAAA